jgi:hypothetical protein
MGTVIHFPSVLRTGRAPRWVADKAESATVIILPAVRIERHGWAPTSGSEPETSNGARKRRRRRAGRA